MCHMTPTLVHLSLAANVELRLRTAIDASYILATEQLERVKTDTKQFATGTKKSTARRGRRVKHHVEHSHPYTHGRHPVVECREKKGRIPTI